MFNQNHDKKSKKIFNHVNNILRDLILIHSINRFKRLNYNNIFKKNVICFAFKIKMF